MSEIREYKCPCCGAPLSFNAKKQKMHCESCGTDFEMEAFRQIDEANEEVLTTSHYDWQAYEPREYDQSEETKLTGYTCPSCAASIAGDENMGSTVCPYCGNATIVKDKFEGTLRPDFVIPFSVDKKQAMEEFEEAAKKVPFLPNEFKNQKKVEEMAGVYVPFWLFDCDCNANINYNAQIVTTWSDSKNDYTKTDFFRLIRSGSIGFANIPVDGSQKIDNDYMESLEPFRYSDAMDFNSAYLSGYLADKYDVAAEDCIDRANERVKASTEEAFKDTTGGYMSVIPTDSHISFSDGKIRYALLPVWMLNIKYKDETYKFAINGQTGKTVGIFPICKKKKNLYLLKTFAISTVVALAAACAYINIM